MNQINMKFSQDEIHGLSTEYMKFSQHTWQEIKSLHDFRNFEAQICLIKFSCLYETNKLQ